MTPEMEITDHVSVGRKMEDPETRNCPTCGTVYQIRFLGPDVNYNDFGIWFCPYCGDLTQSIPMIKTRIQKAHYVLVTISGGLIDQVTFYEKAVDALAALSGFVKTMEPENDDAGVYTKGRLIANAKDFLDENDEFMGNSELIKKF